LKRKPLKLTNCTADPGSLIREAVLYTRVSSKGQERDGFSLDAQSDLLQEYADKHSFRCVEKFVDIETAHSTGRSQFGAMLNFLEHSPNCRVVLVEKLDRLLRTFEDFVTLRRLDLELHFVKQGRILSKNSTYAELMACGFDLVISVGYVYNLKEESMKGTLQKAKSGLYPGQPALGYMNVELPNGKGGIAPDPVRAPIMTCCFERFATGNYSLKELTAWARTAGLRSRKGNLVSKSSLQNYLRNRIYTGDFTFNGQLYTGSHIPLVSVELWERVQEVLDKHRTYRHRVVKHGLAFSGLMRCGHCGCAIVGEIKKNRYVYYHCTGQRGKCPKLYVREELLEEQFSIVIGRVMLPPSFVDWAVRAVQQSGEKDRLFRQQAITSLNSELARIQKRLDAMYRDKLDGRISSDMYDRNAREWSEQAVTIRRQIEQHRMDDVAKRLDHGAELLELTKNARKLFDAQLPREKRKLLNFVVSNSTLTEDKLTVTYRQPFDLFATWSEAMKKPPTSERLENGQNEEWLLR
jgi:DNA invertase Pin-like site-specific DNA recombinase